jgi:signal peptidase II
VKALDRLAAFAVALGVFAADRWSKWMVLTHLSPDTVKPVIPGFFNLVHSENPGIAFGIFADDSGRWHTPVLVTFSIVAVAILAAMLWKIDKLDRYSALGLSLIFGGAMGNLYDRVRVGSVTDFLDFYLRSYHWYVFNVADSAVCVGAGLLLLSIFFARPALP